MLYKREEAFRFSLKSPILGFFSIKTLNGLSGESKKGALEVLDISPNGLRFSSHLELPFLNDVELIVSFELNNRTISIPGYIVWKKKHLGKWIYGFSAGGDNSFKDTLKQEIIRELKSYIKNNRYD